MMPDSAWNNFASTLAGLVDNHIFSLTQKKMFNRKHAQEKILLFYCRLEKINCELSLLHIQCYDGNFDSGKPKSSFFFFFWSVRTKVSGPPTQSCNDKASKLEHIKVVQKIWRLYPSFNCSAITELFFRSWVYLWQLRGEINSDASTLHVVHTVSQKLQIWSGISD